MNLYIYTFQPGWGIGTIAVAAKSEERAAQLLDDYHIYWKDNGVLTLTLTLRRGVQEGIVYAEGYME